MTLSPTLITDALADLPGHTRLVVGFSGGLDSTVLLHLAQQCRQTDPALNVAALHVNHQLQPAADQWQLHCELLCRHWQIPFLGDIVRVDRDQASLEQAARDARYAAFRRHLQPGDLLLLAHHRDDQVETLFQRLLRGSGPLGLGGMGSVSRQPGLTILRPLLEQDRADLEAYARDQGLGWIDDPSNGDTGFERNFLRHQVLPSLRTRWPRLNQTVARAARLSRDSAQLLDELALIDAGEPVTAGNPLPIPVLQSLSHARAMNLLRYWIRQHGTTAPSEAQLARVLMEILPAQDDAQPVVSWGQHQLRRYRQGLYCLPLLPVPAPVDLPFVPGEDAPLLPVGRLIQAEGQGTAFSRTRLHQGDLRLRTRQGGERLKPAGRPGNSLKHWLQALQVPPWWRDHWPILYAGDEIAGLPGLVVCEGFQPAGPEDGLWLGWQSR